MVFLGNIINFLAVLILGIVGSFFKKGIPERITNAIICAMGICVLYIGIDGIMEQAPPVPEDAFFSAGLTKVLIMIVSMGLGTLLGELIDLDKQMNRFGEFLEKKFSKNEEEKGRFAKGFASCSILFCVGAMAVNGSIQDALGNPDILIAKAAVDGIMVLVMSSALGIGCAFSAFALIVYQGALTLIAMNVLDFLPEATVSYMSITGSLLIVLIGTNMLGMTKVKTANMVFAMFIPILFAPLITLI